MGCALRVEEKAIKADSILGVWSGTAANNNGFDLDISVSITESAKVGVTLGTFTIPAIPFSGTFKLLQITGDMLELKTENLQGPCGAADTDSLELLPDGTLLYVSRGEGWEARGILHRSSDA